jgi:lipid-A-disaccharide synthase
MLVAAEASGDTLGAGLARALKARLGEGVRFVGVGGAKMREQGIDSPFDIAELSILGWIEGLKAYGKVRRRVRDTAEFARRTRPDVAVLIDSWGFTLRVAKALRRDNPNLVLIKYVAPQVWASRPGRAKTLAASVDHLLAMHAFDAPWFENEGLETTFVGNSTLALDFSDASGERFRRSIGAGPEDPVLLVLPGSRRSEIKQMMPPFEEAIALLKRQRPGLHVAVVVADTVADEVRGRVAGWPFRAHLIEGEAAKRDAMRGATVALACSGTVSTELALAGAPMIISYRLDNLSYQLIKRFITVRFVTLLNIASDEAIAPELLQNDATGPKLAAAVAERLDDPALRREQVRRQYEALDRMGRGMPDPAETAAEAVIAVMREKGLAVG